MIIKQRIIAAAQSPNQKPFNPKLNLNANVQPSGIEINQYATKFDNNTTPVFLIPLKIPDNATCNPSNTWNIASTYKIGIEIFIKTSSWLNSLTKNSGKDAKIIALQVINPTQITVPTNEYFFKSFMFPAPFANPTFTAIAFEIANGTINDTVVKVQIRFCAAA